MNGKKFLTILPHTGCQKQSSLRVSWKYHKTDRVNDQKVFFIHQKVNVLERKLLTQFNPYEPTGERKRNQLKGEKKIPT